MADTIVEITGRCGLQEDDEFSDDIRAYQEQRGHGPYARLNDFRGRHAGSLYLLHPVGDWTEQSEWFGKYTSYRILSDEEAHVVRAKLALGVLT